MLLGALSWNQPAAAAELKADAVIAFDKYVETTEQRMSGELKSDQFLWPDAFGPGMRDAVYARLKNGEIIVEPLQSTSAVPGGMIHHWRGIVFISSANLSRTLLFLQNYDDQYKYYWPEVQKSKLLRGKNGHFDVWLRLKRAKVVTVFLDAQFSIDYTSLDETHALSRSHSTQILEVENAETPNERHRPEGNDNGYLWRLNSCWRLQQRDGGVYVQLEAVSLTRDIPEGLGWLVRPFVVSIPRESVLFTLSRTREALTVK